MHFGFALDLSDIDLLNVDLLDQRYTHSDLFVSKTSWRRLQDMSLRRLQDMSSRHVFKTYSKHVFKTYSRRLQRNNFSSSKTSWRCFQDVLRDLFKTSWRRLEDQQMFVGVDAVLEQHINYLPNNKWLGVKYVLIVFG